MNDTTNNQEAAAKPEWAKSKTDLRRERGEKPSRVGRVIWTLLIILVIGGAAAMALKPKPETMTSTTDQPVLESVKYLAAQETAVIQPTTLYQRIKVNGTVQPLNVSQLPALISAQVEEITVRTGDKVTKGQLLLAMDTENLLIQKEQQLSAVAATQAQLALAESQLKRTQEMSAQGIATSSQLEQAASNVQAQKANLQSQQSQIKATDYQLRNANVYAPMNGIIASRQAEPGQFVGTGSPLLSVVDLSRLEFLVNVSTTDSAAIVIGMKVEISVEGLPGDTFTGTVNRISPTTSNGTRTIPVHIVLNNVGETLRGGMFATGQITLESKPEAIAVSNNAIHYDEQNHPYLLKIVDNTIAKQLVTLGATWGESQQREITEGLIAGDHIIVLPMQGLQVGDAVQLIEG